jgi:hypothetical protein
MRLVVVDLVLRRRLKRRNHRPLELARLLI